MTSRSDGRAPLHVPTRRPGPAGRATPRIPSPRPPLDDRVPVAPPADAAARLVGRGAERALLAEELRRVRSRRPRVVLVDGPAGIGKTALVEHVLAGEADLLVLRGGGREDRVTAELAVVGQLLRGRGGSGAWPQATGAEEPSLDEPNRVGGRLFRVLVELERQAPVAVVVDDLQWVDVGSVRALLYAMRRLTAERVLAVLTARVGGPGGPPPGLVRLASGATGTTLHLGPLTPGDVQVMAAAAGPGPVPARVGPRLHAHTGGNPAHVRALLDELPRARWCSADGTLPAPRGVARSVRARLLACDPPVRRLVEAVAVLGDGARPPAAAALASVRDPLAALEEADRLGLLDVTEDHGIAFPDPLVRAAVYEQLDPARRVRLHRAAAGLVDDDGAALRHRVHAADPPDDRLAGELRAFAERQSEVGAWGRAAAALLAAARLSSTTGERERCLLRSVDLAAAGDLTRARTYAPEVRALPPGPLRDVVLSHLAVLGGRPEEARTLLAGAWHRCAGTGDRGLTAVVAHRRAMDAAARLAGSAVVDWARRARSLAGPDRRLAAAAAAVLGVGLGWTGQVRQGLAVTADGQAPETGAARGTLRLAAGDIGGARADLAEAAAATERIGAFDFAVWAYVWSSRAEFLAGSWDAAVVAADRAVALAEEIGHESLRPLARWAAVEVPAARGEWAVAADHARRGAARSGDYELMVLASGLAHAQLAAAREDAEGVLRALEPVVAMTPRDGVDEPGFWPWHVLYADALVGTGRLAEAEAFLAPQEELTAARGSALSVAELARVRGRLEAAAGRADAAEAAFRQALDLLGPLSVPFPRGLVELAFGRVLRRHGHRRAAAEQLHAARDRFTGLGARPYVERCERELGVCGPGPGGRRGVDPARLTAQELAVARLVAGGMSNRQVAAELFISVKTVQFHLTRVYSKLGIGSRVELVAHGAWPPAG